MKTQTELDDLALLLADLTDAEREVVLATAEQFRIAARQNTKDAMTNFVDSLTIGSPAESEKRRLLN